MDLHQVCQTFCHNQLEHTVKKKFVGGAGYRSRYLSHAKRALYHLSYAPQLMLAAEKGDLTNPVVVTFMFKVTNVCKLESLCNCRSVFPYNLR